jgi:nitroreductase
MDVFEAVRTILTVRSYQDRPIPGDVLQRIVEAGRLTGSSMNGQPWHFIVVQDHDTLRQLGALARTGGYTADAPAAIVVVTEPSRFAVSDASRAIQSMALAAWSEGVASGWAGFGGLEALKPVLGIPDTLDVFAIVPLGYPDQAVGQGKKNRKPLADVAHRERFGTPFS